MKIILDTNFLMAVTQFKIDVFTQLRGNELYTLDKVVDELVKHSKTKAKKAVAAKVALKLVESKGLKVLVSKENDTDTALLEYSKIGYCIATQDRLLLDQIKKSGSKAIYIRQKKYLLIK
jgi:rRNA-processing protein FCF1